MARWNPTRAVAALAAAALLWMAAPTAVGAQAAPPQRDLIDKRTVMVKMRDGTQLATDLYVPSGKGPFPTLVVRLPYNKNMLTTSGGEAISKGYALVTQDTRGRFASEGANLPFDGDGWWENRWDGFDTLEWVAKQPWCSGKVGTFGGSALGITQLFEAGSGSSRLGAQVIHVGAPSMYFDMAFPGGVFKKSMIEDWLRVTSHSPDAIKFWTQHGTYNAFWQTRDVTPRYPKITAPAVHVGGWFDIFCQGTIDAFTGYQTKGGPGARGNQKLIMGPWTHGIFQQRAGDLTFRGGKRPPGKAVDQWLWFDHWIRGIDNGVERDPAVTYYTMGDTIDPKAAGNRWRTSATWPPAGVVDHPIYLLGGRRLSATKPAAGAALTYAYDPANPAPTIGGPQLTLPAGPHDQRTLEDRADVLVFSTDPLTTPFEVTGRVRAKLWIASDCLDTDFFVKVCDVYPDGRSFNVLEGQLRARFREGFRSEKMLKPGQPTEITVDLASTSYAFHVGHRLRVLVTSSNAPGYDPNPNTGDPFRANDRRQIAHNTVYVDSQHPSRIVLPIAEGKLPE